MRRYTVGRDWSDHCDGDRSWLVIGPDGRAVDTASSTLKSCEALARELNGPWYVRLWRRVFS